MLRGLDPLMSPALLYHLASMGHGDELAVVDRNFPASATASRLVRLPSAGLVAAVKAILTVFPLDQWGKTPFSAMARGGSPATFAPSVTAAFEMSLEAAGRSFEIEALEAQSFYTRARSSFAVLATGEEQLYGCILLRKGVVLPEETHDVQ